MVSLFCTRIGLLSLLSNLVRGRRMVVLLPRILLVALVNRLECLYRLLGLVVMRIRLLMRLICLVNLAMVGLVSLLESLSRRLVSLS